MFYEHIFKFFEIFQKINLKNEIIQKSEIFIFVIKEHLLLMIFNTDIFF